MNPDWSAILTSAIAGAISGLVAGALAGLGVAVRWVARRSLGTQRDDDRARACDALRLLVADVAGKIPLMQGRNPSALLLGGFELNLRREAAAAAAMMTARDSERLRGLATELLRREDYARQPELAAKRTAALLAFCAGK